MMSESAQYDLHDAIHSLAQPLTALIFAVEMAYVQASTEQVKEVLASARTECRRAMDMLEKVREAAERTQEEVMGCNRI